VNTTATGGGPAGAALGVLTLLSYERLSRVGSESAACVVLASRHVTMGALRVAGPALGEFVLDDDLGADGGIGRGGRLGHFPELFFVHRSRIV
jgi:hypothetical protein